MACLYSDGGHKAAMSMLEGTVCSAFDTLYVAKEGKNLESSALMSLSFFKGCTHGIWKFPDHESNLSYTSDPNWYGCSDNAKSNIFNS